ncbi:hypothetical protein LXM94_25580 [Rhizobium sp. TRM95111]|uniref:hypothetical protein n=1 Tax=Rhizobium alarense TaxID=2846851 RepID=UPI001F1C4C3A|nr:hypothetical protein [Rhizobium alarense]MCF3643329.1 hypothetical protein [Rhizobium alarense]
MGDTNDILLTAATVREWQDEGAKIDEEMNSLQKRRDEITRKLEAVRLLFPQISQQPKNLSAVDALEEQSETMVDATLRILRSAESPLGHSEIRAILSRDGRLKEKLISSPNYYYTMISRLLNRTGDDRVVKIGDRYAMANKSSIDGEAS